MVLQGKKGLKVSPDKRVNQDHQEETETQETTAMLETLERKEKKELPVQKVSRGPQD